MADLAIEQINQAFFTDGIDRKGFNIFLNNMLVRVSYYNRTKNIKAVVCKKLLISPYFTGK
jgi:hypothetical protein